MPGLNALRDLPTSCKANSDDIESSTELVVVVVTVSYCCLLGRRRISMHARQECSALGIYQPVAVAAKQILTQQNSKCSCLLWLKTAQNLLLLLLLLFAGIE